jgi:hypothetical protein
MKGLFLSTLHPTSSSAHISPPSSNHELLEVERVFVVSLWHPATKAEESNIGLVAIAWSGVSSLLTNW